MSDKPNFLRIPHEKIGNAVRTQDGRFFYNYNHKFVRRLDLCLRILVNAIFIATPGILILNGCLPLNIYFDFALVSLFATVFTRKLLCCLSKYEEISEDDQDYVTASGMFTNKRTLSKHAAHIVTVICFMMLIFAVINSSTVLYLLSKIENRPILIQVTAKDETINVPAPPTGGDTEQLIVPPDKDLSLAVTITGAIEKLQVQVDGEINDWVIRGPHMSWFWEDEYFISDYYVFIDNMDIRDGSVLEMTCGDLHRKWVFDVTGEDAA